jgi:hypothetical protein
MQRGLLVCAVLWAAVAAAAEEKEAAPEAEARKTFVGLVATSLGRGVVAIDGEHALSTRLSIRTGIRISGGMTRDDGNAALNGDTSNLSVGLEPGIRYYVMGTALDGMWIGPHVELSRGRFTTTSTVLGSLNSPVKTEVTNHGREWSVGVGALVGYSMVVSRGLTVQAGVGLGGAYTSSRTDFGDTGISEQPNAMVFRMKRWEASERAMLAVGWSF